MEYSKNIVLLTQLRELSAPALRFEFGMRSIFLVLLILCFSSIAAAQHPSRSPEVAITIDDIDMNADDTPKLSLDERNRAILDKLRRHKDLKAGLFVCGMRVDNAQGKKHLREWDEAGHLIGNHSYSHFYFPNTDFAKFSADIVKGESVISRLKNFRRYFRFPYLKEGETADKRDKIRAFLKQRSYRMGYVTIDTSEWAIDARLRKRLNGDPNADLTPYRDFYLEHIWERTQFYDQLARKVTGRPVKHTLLIHHNLLAALFLDDLLKMYEQKGWKLINAADAFKDPVFKELPDVVPAGESIIWSLAKASGNFDKDLRYPAEDERYEKERMDELGL